ncbi:MAG: response regulator [Chloroflexi bacterium]|nr:response regulator [Chloroflexota bacterium]
MGLRVVLVEDEATLRRIIARNLTARGCEVFEAGTAKEAARLILHERPDVVLLDINLPDRSGWDVLREVRRHGAVVPTIVVSAVRVNPARLEEFAVRAFLPKPFPLEALLHLVLGAGAVAPEGGSDALAGATGGVGDEEEAGA